MNYNFLSYQNSIFSKSELQEIIDTKKDEYICRCNKFIDISNIPLNIEFITSVLAAYSNHLSININSDKSFPIRYESIAKWMDFNKKFLCGKNIKKVYVENSPTVINSLIWLTAFDNSLEIFFSDKPQSADLAIVSLSSLAKHKLDILNYKCVISCGTELVEFNDLKKSDTPWVNYYGFPYCYCVSFSQSCDVLGKTDIYHQLKPVMGFSAYVTDKTCKNASVNIVGKLSQKYDNIILDSPYKAVFTSDGKLISKGIDDEFIILNGRLTKKADISNQLLSTKFISDCAVNDNIVYYTTNDDITPFQVFSAVKITGADKLLFREAPYIPKNNENKINYEELSHLTDAVYYRYKMINDAIKSDFNGDFCTFVKFREKPEIDVYFLDNAADIAEIVNSTRGEYTVNLYKVKTIYRYSKINSDINISSLKNSIISMKILTSKITKLQKKLSDIWKNVLSIKEVDIDDDFFKLGGNSMLLIKLAFDISDALNIDLQIQNVMIYRTIRKFSDYIETCNNHNDEGFAEKLNMITEDIKYDINIKERIKNLSISEESSVLIIGEPDFKCLSVINLLINKFDSVYFMAKSISEMNIRQTLKNFEFSNSSSSKLHIINGDISKPYFGLIQNEYLQLTKSIKMVYHFGIDMNLIASYESIRENNINGTKRVIKFCCETCAKKLVFISSLAALKSTARKTLAVCSEITEIAPDMLRKITNKDYIYSVYAADKLVQEAHKKGLDTVVIRCPRIMGDSITGKFQTDDIIWLIIKYLINKKLSPEIYIMQEFITPADILSKQIISLSTIKSSENFIYNLKGVEAEAQDIINWLNSTFPNLRHITMNEWSKLVKSDPFYADNTIIPMLGHLSTTPKEDNDCSYISDEITQDVIRTNNISTYEGHTLKEIMDTTFSYLNSIGYFNT